MYVGLCVCGWPAGIVCVCVWVYHCTVELCEGGGSSSLLLLVRLLLENDQSCVHGACKRESMCMCVCVCVCVCVQEI